MTSSVTVITVVGLIVLVFLVWLLKNRHRSNALEDFHKKRRDGGAKLVGVADYVEGMEHMSVSLALTDQTIFYENEDFQAQLDLERLDEVEYDDELSTGKEVQDGKVLRLRSHGHTFDFILTRDDAAKWQALLPPHRMNEPGGVHTV